MASNWEDIRLFLAIARAESLTGAGRGLQRDPATLSRRMTRLEERLNVTLFAKSPQGYALTEAGRDLMAQALAAEDAMRAAEARMALHTAGAQTAGEGPALRGPLRLGAPDGCANFILPQVCARIVEDHPDLDIQIVALPRVFNLSQREADFAITVSAPTAGRLVVQKITNYSLHLAAGADYLDRYGRPEHVDDLMRHRIVGYIPDMIFDRELDYLADLGVGRVAMASNSVSVQLNMLRQNAGIGVAHDFALPFAREVERVLCEEVSLSRAFYLIRHEADRGNPRLARAAQLLSQGIRQEVQRLESEV
ncbi:MAG: LysR family transcriptional regulator [Rhodobacteraceae bacterium]|nr:LysR family transcriptional regulator [Paracoccaceae bacterium]